jgi:hypothetical protein
MTNEAQQLLSAFDSLRPSDQREVTAALLRRTLDEAPGELSDDILLGFADDLFGALDAEEARQCH